MRSPEYWRDKADEARAMAGEMTAPASQDTLLQIAEDYERLARFAEEEEKRARRRAQSWTAAFLSRSS